MAVITIYRLSEEIKKLLDGGDPPLAADISFNEIKISIGQVLNSLLKVEYFDVNIKTGNTIPDGYVIATYDNISVTQWTNARSKATIPVKPMLLPRNMGIWSVYITDDPDNEFIPVAMGRTSLLKSQSMISDILNQTSYESRGMELRFNKDLTQLYPGKTLTAELVIMDISQYDDYTPLPVPPEYEWRIKQDVVKLYREEPIPDKIVDSTSKEKRGIPINQQTQ